MRYCVSLLFLFILTTSTVTYSDELFDTSINAMQSLSWQERAPGVWSAVVGEMPDLVYTDFAAASPRVEALGEMAEVGFPLDAALTHGQVLNGRAVARIPLEPDEKLYGLGLQFDGLNRRGEVFHLRMDHYSRGNDRLHAPVPFYISSAGYGVLFNNPRYISIYAGIGNRKDSPEFPEPKNRNAGSGWSSRPISDAVEASVYDDGMEVIVFAGPTMLDVMRRYNLYMGGGSLPPKWGLGFWHRMRTLANDEEVLNEISEFEQRDFPLDVIGLEPGWHTKSYPCTYEWNPELFPNPAEFVEQVSQQGVKLNLWENPYVSPDASMYDDILQYTGSHTVWLGVVPDFTMTEAQEIYTKQHEAEHLDIGVSGYKFDEVDGYDIWLWPDHASFPSGTSAEVMRQTYALQIQQMMMEVFKERNQRTYSLVRASNAGASAYPFAIYTDHYDHEGFVTALINSGLCGVLYTPEIRSARSPEEWVRRMQSVCFSHLVQLNGWSSNTKPWSFPEVNDEVREVMQLRIRLLPYIYTAFAKYHFEGTPPIRPMILEPGYLDQSTLEEGELDHADNPYAQAVRRDVTDQFMFGDSILVAPIFTGENQREVILPHGKWYDFYTGEFAGGGEIITVEPALNRIPLYVKEGGIIPMLKEPMRLSQLPDEINLEIRHYGKTPATFQLYDDDGETFDYENGEHCWLELAATELDGALSGEVAQTVGDYESGYPDFAPKSWHEI